jgi:tetratricopeptide (TPR) repeat protein
MYKKLITEAPTNGDLYYYYGISVMKSYYSDTLNISFDEKADSAKAIFELGIRHDPANPLNLVGLGALNLIKNDLLAASTDFEKAQALLPSKANKLIKMAPDRQAKVLLHMAEAYVIASVRDTATTFNFLRRAEKLDNKNPELYIVKGDVYFYLLNDGSKAITNYNMAQALDPKSPQAKLKIGQLWLRARQYTTALNYYQEVVKMDSTFAPAYRELGTLLSRAGRQEEAKKNFARFLELSGNISARKQYVNVLIELKDYPEAINQLFEIRKSDTADNDVNRALAYSYFETQQYDKALLYSQKFFANANPEKIRATDYIYYGRALARLKMDSLAPEQLLKGYQMDTSKSELISEAALCWVKVKRYDKGKELYEQKILLNKATPMDYYNLGKVYYSIQEYKKADTNLAIFISMQPDYLQGIMWRARTKSNLDSTDAKGFRVTGYAKPIYEIYLEKTASDSLKYMKDRFECYDYLAYYYYSQFSRDPKNREAGEKSLYYYNLLIAIFPNDPKAGNFKEAVNALKLKLK